MRRLLVSLLVILVLLSQTVAVWAAAEPTASPGGTVVLVFQGDEYLSLAEEIAQAEGLPLVRTWEDALAGAPETVLWVASPRQLSDEVMVQAGMALKQHGELPAIGIFTGGTQEEARQLWQRGQQMRTQTDVGASRRFFAANGEHPTAGAPQAVLTDFQADPPQTVAMDRSTLVEALQQADYLTFSGHGSDDYLRIDPETKLLAGDLPALPPVIVGTSSCQTLRMWLEDSIALGFVRQGAAAYAGFVYSPLAGYMVGQFQDLPFRYTWPEFPIGRVAALQTRGTLQAFANFPFYYVLGDPRIALQSEPPYQIVRDETRGSVRTLTIQGAPQGLIPVRVPDGGRYQYVEVPGLAATADGDAFFNARIQAASLGGDKHVVVEHPGGDLTLRLRETAPWTWRLTHPLLAAFDHVALFTPLNGGDLMMVVLGGLALLVALLRGWRQQKRAGVALRPVVLTAGVTALSVTLLLGLYQALRLPHVAISTKPMAFNGLWLVGVFLLTASGVGLYLLGRGWFSRLLGLAVAATPALLPAAFGLAAITGTNLLISRQIGAGIYNLSLGSVPGIAAAVWMAALGVGLKVVGFWAFKPSQARRGKEAKIPNYP